MSEAQWQIVWRVYRDACEMAAGDRRAYVESQSPDPGIAIEVLELLDGSSQPTTSYAPIPTPVRTGSTVGRYKVGSLLGRGGMGEVYSGLDLALDRRVALKFLLPHAVDDEWAASRFLREAKAASHLNHPNVVTIHEVVSSESGFVIAMELVEGRPLREYCGRPLALAQALNYVRQVALALAAAHANNIVHRDIKPENIMVRPDHFAKVLDFGLARALSGNAQGTMSGLPFGTLSYMSPEQLRGEELTGASDVFSLGVVLYELVARRHPFEAPFAWETAYAINNRQPPPPGSSENPVAPALEGLILTLLAKEPKDRPTAAELADALGNLGALPGTAPSVRRLRLSRSSGGVWRSMRTYAPFSPVRSVGIPVLVVTAAIGVTIAVRTSYGGRAPITLLSAAVFIGALYGGFLGGLLTTALAIASVHFLFKQTVYNLMGSDSNLLSLAISGFIFTLIASSLARARR